MEFGDITVLIPTHNRKYYLKRILEYYSDINVNILVADSSAAAAGEEILSVNANVTYLHYPNMDYVKKMRAATQYLNTKYVAVTADDDFTNPSAIYACADFLENNPEYSVANGRYISYEVSKHKVTYNLMDYSIRNLNINNYSVIERLNQFFYNLAQLVYSVTYSKYVKEFFQNLYLDNIDPSLLEQAYAGFQIIKGSYKVLPVFYGMREINRDVHLANNNLEGLKYMASEKRNEDAYMYFVNNLSKMLIMEYPNIGTTLDCEEIIKTAVNKYVQRCARGRLLKKFLWYYMRPLRKHIIQLKESYLKIRYSKIRLKEEGYPFSSLETEKAFEKMKMLICKYSIVIYGKSFSI